MTAAGQATQDWIKVWIDSQRAAVDKWLDTQKTPAAADQAAAFGHLFQQFAGTAQPSGMGDFGNQIGALWRSFSPTSTVNGGLPGLGLLREQQETLQGLVSAIGDYQRFSGEVARVLAKVHSDTLDLLARRSLEQANAGQPIDSFKALYDLWIECGETTYAKVAQGDAYCRLQADLCNAGIRVQSHQQQLLERWLKQLDLPTRSELNTLHQRVQELKRRLDTVTGARDELPQKKASRTRAKPVAGPESALQGTSARSRTARKKS